MMKYIKGNYLYIVVGVALVLYVALVAIGPFAQCRSQGHSVAKCVITTKYWVQKAFWEF